MNTLQIRDAVLAGELSAEQRVVEFLQNIEQKNPHINAILHLNKHAVAQAKHLDQRIEQGEDPGKLTGLVVSVKSNISVKGQIVNCASLTLKDFVGAYDADVIERITNEGAIIIGMVNMDEFASGGSGETSAFGPTKNPANDLVIPGGTSSGSAASVAAGFCDLSLGSDTGGSIRNPASHCGVVGVKPSYGRVSRYGLVDMAMSFDQIGPLARDVQGAALLMEVIAGYSERDPTTQQRQVGTYSSFTNQQGLRIGFCPELEKLCSDQRIVELVREKAKEVVDKQEWRVTDITLDHVELAVQTYYPIVYVEFFSGTRKFDGRKYGKAIDEVGGDEVKRRILGGKEISKAEHKGAYYRKALQAKAAISDSFTKAFGQCDVIVTPVTPSLPWQIGQMPPTEEWYAADALTTPANLAGICAGVVPIGQIDGVPIGLQIFAPAFGERKLFDVMQVFDS